MSVNRDKVLWTDHTVVSAYSYDGRLISRKEFEPKVVTLGELEDAIKKIESFLESD